MATRKRTRSLVTLRHSLNVEVHEPALKISDSFRYLDVAALAKAARAEVAIGEVDGGCCRQKVYATIRKGRVVGLRTDKCAKGERAALSREDMRLVAKAIQRVKAKRGGRGGISVPVETFFSNAATARQISIQVLVCVRFCFFGFCITCCRLTNDPAAPILCGHVTIDTTVLD